jgi:hypothetical protein
MCGQASSANSGEPMIATSTGAFDLSEPAGPQRVEYGDSRGRRFAFGTARLEIATLRTPIARKLASQLLTLYATPVV